MIALSTVMEIDRLLQEGKLSRRRIAARLGVSHGIVDAIANGKRALIGKQEPRHSVPSVGSRARPERCPRCGHRVILPCQVCVARHYRELQKQKSRVAPAAICRQGIRQESSKNTAER